MFEDSNKGYTGLSAGVAGGKPATPVSLSAVQEAAVRAAVAAAFNQLQRQQQVVDMQATQEQLYQIVREMIQSKQQSVEPHVVLKQWEQRARTVQINPKSARTAVRQEEGSTTNKGEEKYFQKPSGASSKSEPALAKNTSVDDTANKTSVVDGASEQSAKDSIDEQETPDKYPEVTVGGTEPSGLESQAGVPGSNGPIVSNAGQAVSEPQQSSSVSQSTASNPLVDNQAQDSGHPPVSEPVPAGQEAVTQSTATPDGRTVVADKGASDEASAHSQTADTSLQTHGSGVGVPAAGPETPTILKASPELTNHRPPGSDMPGEVGPSLPTTRAGESQLRDELGGQQYNSEGLPTGVRDRFKRGFEDRKSGKGFKDAYSARKLPSGGSAVKGLGEGAAKGAAENVAKEGAKDVAATAAQAAAKEGVKDTAKLASKTTPVGLLTNIDAKGAYKAAKDLKNLKVVSAVKGVTQSAAVTLFRASYDPWVIGFTLGLSLIVTLVVGSVIFFTTSSMTFLERLLVVALWILLLFIVLLVLGLMLIGVCNGPTGWGVWAASWVSKAAADINKFCEPIGALQAATRNITR